MKITRFALWPLAALLPVLLVCASPALAASAPTISSLSPSVVVAGGAAFTLTINGANFTSEAAVSWDSTSLTTTYKSASKLTAAVPASLIATAGTASVTVTVGSATSSAVTFTIESQLSLPAASSTPLRPALAGYGYGGTVNASGGNTSGGNYSFTVNGIKIPAVDQTGTLPTSWTSLGTSGDGLSAANSGGNTLWFAGTPTTAKSVSLKVTVTDATNSKNTASATYILVVNKAPAAAHNSYLKGRYTCLYQGVNDSDSSRVATLISMVADGKGNLANGTFDTNSRRDTTAASGTITGTYLIAANNTGLASDTYTLTSGGTASGTNKWALAITGSAQPAQQFTMIQIDDAGTSPSGQHGSARCYLDTTSAFATTLSGGYVFKINGEGSGGGLKAGVGRFSAAIGTNSSSGTISKGYLDMARQGKSLQSSAFTGSYTAPNTTTGRLTLTLNASSGSTSLVYYIIDAYRGFVLDVGSTDGAQAGDVRKQQQTSYSAASLNGAFVLYTDGVEYSIDSAGNTYVSGYGSQVFQGSSNGKGKLSINQSYADWDGNYTAGEENGSMTLTSSEFSSTYPGRLVIPMGSGTGYIYLYDKNSAMEVDVNRDGYPDWGWIEPQTQTSFTDAKLAGSYMLSQVGGTHDASVGLLAITSGGAADVTIIDASEGEFSWDQIMDMTYNWDSTTYGTFLVGSGSEQEVSCAAITASRLACTLQTDDQPSVMIMQQ
jgi:hypothetical protein